MSPCVKATKNHLQFRIEVCRILTVISKSAGKITIFRDFLYLFLFGDIKCDAHIAEVLTTRFLNPEQWQTVNQSDAAVSA